MKLLNDITPIEKDFARWYTDVVVKGNMIRYGNIQGSMIFKPIAFGIWENIQTSFNKIIKEKAGAENVQLPLLIPLKMINKEKEHIKGFAPELATITHVGDKELTDKYVVRPTSEVLFSEYFANEIRSYKNLPIKVNQWVNVVRWEKTTNPFLRNREFLWQEGHTAHADPAEARKLARKMIKVYSKFLKEYLGIATLVGKKTAHEKFAGAVTTYTIEAMMKDGKALQSGTSHYLGQNFAKNFDIQFVNKDNKKEYAYQTSWGISTRLIGAIIMSHGDNRGIIIPPRVAPYQIDILEIFGNKNPEVAKMANLLKKQLGRKYRVRLDNTDKAPGHKAAQSEIEGTPLRIEVGPRDLENDSVTVVRRDTLEKQVVKVDELKATIKNLLNEIHENLYKKSKTRLEENTVSANSYEEMKGLIKDKKFVIVPFAGGKKEEEKIKGEIQATTRCIYSLKEKVEKPCIITGKLTKRYVVFAKAY